jgi:hypothetical protein
MEHFYTQIFGCFECDSLYTDVVKSAGNDAHFVEIGPFKGKSSSFMAVEIINSGKNIKFDCVDNWKGNPEHHANGPWPDQDVINGTVFEQFTKNMKPVEGNYTAISMDSVEAAKLYADQSLDFVFIDGNHSYESVKADIIAWTPKIKPGGILAGNEFRALWPDLRRAVEELIWDLEFEYVAWKTTIK